MAIRNGEPKMFSAVERQYREGWSMHSHSSLE